MASRRRMSVQQGVSPGRRMSIAAGLESVPPASISFSGIELSLPPENAVQRHTVFKNVSGAARTGELCAIMGPSGAGKTSLMTAIAGGARDRDTRDTRLSGSLWLNGEATELGSLVSKRIASYVTQEECLRPRLTVRETLLFAAELQLPSSPQTARLLRIGEVLRDLELESKSDDWVETLSGGERRRLSIGCEGLLSSPLLMFLDEPTSGLSSHDALMVCRCLSKLAKESDYTIILTIHQPPQEAFELIDRIILLASGSMVYSGIRQDLPNFFRQNGVGLGGSNLRVGAKTASPTHGDADELMDWISDHNEAKQLASKFEGSRYARALARDVGPQALSTDGSTLSTSSDGIATNSEQMEVILPDDVARSFCSQIKIVLCRELKCMWRNQYALTTAVAVSILSCSLFGAVYWQLEETAGAARSRMNTIALLLDLPVFVEPSWARCYIDHRPRMQRDLGSGVLSVRAHTFIWFMLTMLRTFVITVPMMTLSWHMTGLNAEMGMADWLMAFMFMWSIKMIIHSMLVLFSMSAAAADAAMGNMGIFYLFWFQFRGQYVLPKDYISGLRWLLHVNPCRNAFNAVSVNMFADTQLLCNNDTNTGQALEQTCPLPGNLLLQQNEMQEQLGVDALTCAAWIIGIFLLIGRSASNWQKAHSVHNVWAKQEQPTTQIEETLEPPASTSTPPPKQLRKLEKSRTLSISADIAQDVDVFLHKPVQLDFAALRLLSASGQVILSDASGGVRPGQILALMGPSGAGKSTLMKTIAGLVNGISGEVKINGATIRDNLLQSRIATYVSQDDTLLYDSLTVQETFVHAAELQLGHAPVEIRKTRVSDVLHGLRLFKQRHTKIAKLSGGERRRVSLGANGLLAPSRLLLLDEITTGLSATDALEVMSVVSDLCQSFEFTAVVTIHSPRTDIFDMIDQVVLLADSNVLYSGPKKKLSEYFSTAGFPLSTDEDQATAMIKIASDKGDAAELASFHKSDWASKRKNDMSNTGEMSSGVRTFKRPFGHEVLCLCRREVKVQCRSMNATVMYLFNMAACGLFQGLLYLRIDPSAENVQSVVGAAWTSMATYFTVTLATGFFHAQCFPIIKDDILAGRYSPSAAMLADFCVCFVRIAVAGCVFAVIVFYLEGFDVGRPTAHLFGFMLPMICTGLFVDSMTVFLLYASFDGGMMLNFAGPVINQFALMGGFFVKASLLPAFLQWMPEVSPLSAAYSLILSSHYEGITIGCGDVSPEQQTVPCPLNGAFVLQALDITTDRYSLNIMLSIAWPIGLRVVAWCAFKFHARQKFTNEASGFTGGYRAAQFFVVRIVEVFYRQVAVVGEDRISTSNIRPDGAVIFVVNHTNLFLDGFVLPTVCATQCSPRRAVSQLVAKSAWRHKPLAALLNASNMIPVVRPQDVAQRGSGTILSIQAGVDNWIVTGVDTDFTKDLHEGCRLVCASTNGWGSHHLFVTEILDKQVALVNAPRKEMMNGDGQILVPDGPCKSTEGCWEYKIIPRLEQEDMYATVTKQLLKGVAVGVFPEGRGNDQPNMLPFKTGFAVMALGAATTSVQKQSHSTFTVSVVPTIMTYPGGNQHRFRSSAIVEFGQPILIDKTMIADYETDRSSAANELTVRVRQEMQKMQAPAPTHDEKYLWRVLRRLFQTEQPDASMYVRLMRFVAQQHSALVAAEDLEYAQLISDVKAYDYERKELGIADTDLCQRISTVSPMYLFMDMLFSGIATLILLVLAAPGVAVGIVPAWLSCYLAGRQQRNTMNWPGSNRTDARDVVASYRAIYGLPIFMVFCCACVPVAAVLVAPALSLPWASAVGVFVVVPILLLATVHICDGVAFASERTRAKKSSLFAGRATLAAFEARRALLAARVRTMFAEVPQDEALVVEQELNQNQTNEIEEGIPDGANLSLKLDTCTSLETEAERKEEVSSEDEIPPVQP